MPLETRSGSGLSLSPELALPPLFTSVRLREMGDAFAHAIAVASQQGAGTLVHVGRFDLAEFALVLEPEEKLAQARRAFYAGMVALIDALAAVAQPETSINIEWPDSVYVNLGLVGGARLAWPPRTREDEIPRWLVFGGMIRVSFPADTEPGANPNVTALDEEGFVGALSNQIIESFARNFMAALDSWEERDFHAVEQRYLERFPREQGLRREIDESGDLLISRAGSPQAERKALVPRLKQPAWFDPVSKGPYV